MTPKQLVLVSLGCHERLVRPCRHWQQAASGTPLRNDTSTKQLMSLAIALSVAFVCCSPSVVADDPPEENEWLAYGASEDDEASKATTLEQTTVATETKSGEWEKPIPLSLSLEYTLVSDYIFRGIHFSEHATEGRETPNHQLGTSIGLDLAPLWGGKAGQCGSINFDTWFEWYGDQDKINPIEDSNNQEIDYSVYYSYSIEPIATDLSIGWIHYYFPNLRDVNNNDRTNEWFFSLEHNDAWAWRWLDYEGEDGILNPTFAFYHDTHLSGGVWMDLGISHGFEFECIPDLTITPSYQLHIDGGYLGPLLKVDDHDTRIAGMTYGIDLTYDLTKLLQLPPWAGEMAISGFLNYFDPTSAVRGTGGNINLEDELYGGMKLAWSW